MSTLYDVELYLKDIIKNTKYEKIVYAAGGYVRDQLLNRSAKDLDLVIDLPNGGIEFAEYINKVLTNENNHCVIFPRFGTAKFSIMGHDIEAVMPRSESYIEGSRKPDVEFSSLKEDAFRRDLTINSLFKNISTGEILDFTGRGLSDIQKLIITTPIDEDITFSDDPLRSLRLVRFLYQLKGTLNGGSGNTLDAIKRNAHKLLNISNERIRDELNKILVVDRPDLAIKMLLDTELLLYILPELVDCVGIKQNHYHCDDVFNHILEVLKNTKPILNQRLMALFHDIGKPLVCIPKNGHENCFYNHELVSSNLTETIMLRLKYSLDEIKFIKSGVKNHMRLKCADNDCSGLSDKSLRKFKYEIDEENLNDVLDLIHADNISHDPRYCLPDQIKIIRERLQNLGVLNKRITLPINGDDLVNELHLTPSKLFNTLLTLIRDKVYENPALTKIEALDIIRNYLIKGEIA